MPDAHAVMVARKYPIMLDIPHHQSSPSPLSLQSAIARVRRRGLLDAFPSPCVVRYRPVLLLGTCPFRHAPSIHLSMASLHLGCDTIIGGIRAIVLVTASFPRSHYSVDSSLPDLVCMHTRGFVLMRVFMYQYFLKRWSVRGVDPLVGSVIVRIDLGVHCRRTIIRGCTA